MSQLTIRHCLQKAADQLRRVTKTSSPLEARLLLAHCLQCRPEKLIADDKKTLTPDQQQKFNRLLERRLKAEPIAYILGVKEFYGLEFEVNSSVLIPRPETEGLVAAVVGWIQNDRKLSQVKILELGVGSGCISLSLAKTLGAGALVRGIDISRSALAVAEKNKVRLRLSNVVFEEGDILLGRMGQNPPAEAAYEVLISNPPYLSKLMMAELAPDIRDHEPSSALVGGEDGLLFYRALFELWSKVVTPRGLIAIETAGPEQQREIRDLVPKDFGPIRSEGPHLLIERS